MKQLIIFNFIGFVAAFLNSTVIFFDNKRNSLGDPHPIGLGVIVAPDILVLPNDFVYQDLEAFANFENFTQNRQKFVEYKLFSHNFTKVNDATFVLKLNNGSKITAGNRKLRISRYPFCENTKNLSVVNFEYEGIALKLSSKKLEGYLCEDKNICANTSNSHIGYNGSPLINTMDNIDYLIGLFDSNSGFKNLTQPCNILPHYDYCNYLLNSTAKIIYCNALEMSRNLNKSGYSEVVLIGNAEIGNVRSFIPFGFGLIIGDREVIVFANDLKKIEAQIENYEIYGSGKETMVAIMAKKDIVLLGIYEPINFPETNIILLKLENAEFESLKKAKFSFDESFVNATDFNDFETLQFVNQKLVFQNNFNIKESKFNFLLGIPVFHNRSVIGFQQNDRFISAFELKNILEKNVRHLSIEPTTTIKAETTTSISTVFQTTSTYNNTNVTTVSNNSFSERFHFIIFVVLFLTYFNFIL